MSKRNIFWFRNDLRLSDNLGLLEASGNADVMAIYILDDNINIGERSLIRLQASLIKLNETLGGNLNFYKGNSKEIIIKLVQEHNISAVYRNYCYEPWSRNNDRRIEEELRKIGVEFLGFNSSLLREPSELLKEDKTPYKVFTPFYNNAFSNAPPPRVPLSKPQALNLIKASCPLYNFASIDDVVTKYQAPGEEAAKNMLETFLRQKVISYKDARDFPAKEGQSYLSSYLRFGEISPNQIYYATLSVQEKNPKAYQGVECFLKELIWREFSYNMLYYFPNLSDKNFQTKFDNFPWRVDNVVLRAWQQGKTGYPIVDAGMRQLLETGYMHNRVRMIVASFLVKNLLLDWREGAKWFMDNLIDADLANNSANWQWVAGSGADAAPYFRIFNPILQGEKFDMQGEYTKEFVPELSHLPVKYLFKPWTAPEQVLKEAGVSLGENYPKPIVDLGFSRRRALDAFKSIT